MLFLKCIKILVIDNHRFRWKMSLCMCLLLTGLIVMVETYGFPPENTSIPDVFAKLFLKESLYLLMIPIFLITLSFTIPNVFEPLRFYRYASRLQLIYIILFNIISTVVIFLTIYFLLAFLYGWTSTGTLENTWKNVDGIPNTVFQGEADLSLFSNSFIFLRYTVSQFFAFLFLGIFSTVLYILLNRFIYVFFIVIGYVLLEKGMNALFGFNIFLNKAEVTLNTWGDLNYLFGLVIYFLGLSLFLLGIMYVQITKKDFILEQEERDS